MSCLRHWSRHFCAPWSVCRSFPSFSIRRKPDETVYVPVEITDPFIEAIRSAQEIGAEVFFVDPDVGDRPHLSDLYPDSYAVRRLGHSAYVERYRIHPQPSSFELQRHAGGIAWKLQSCDPLAEVLVVISLNLLDPVLDAMQQPQAEPLARVRREGVQVLNLHPECLAEILVEFPFVQSVYEARRYGIVRQEQESAAPSNEAQPCAGRVEIAYADC